MSSAGGREPSRLRASLRACTSDGIAYAVMVGCGELYFPAFALLLHATPTEIGVLATVPVLIGSAVQMLTPLLAERVGHRRWVVASAVLQALTFLPLAALAGSERAPFAAILAWVCLYWILALGVVPAWNVWMGRMIPAEVRSRYFGRRNVYIQAALLASLALGGGVLHWSASSRWGAAVGFVALFVIAAAARLISAWFLAAQHEPPAEPTFSHAAAPATVLHGFLDRPYGRITRLVVLMYGAVHLSAAYFTPYMLDELDLSYGEFTVLNATVLVARVLASSYWGELARSFGNRRTLQVAAVLLVPLSGLWTLSDNFGYLVALQLYSGFAWSGFELLTILSFFDCTDERNRARVLAFHGLLTGLAMVSSSLVGGGVLRLLGDAGYSYIFLGSSALRALTVVLFSGKVGHKRAGEHSFGDVFVRVVTFRPPEGAEFREVWSGRRGRSRRAGSKHTTEARPHSHRVGDQRAQQDE